MLELIIATHRKVILHRAAASINLIDLEMWFYSTFWDDLTNDELRHVHRALAKDPVIGNVLGQAVVTKDEHADQD